MLDLVEMEVRELLEQVQVRRATTRKVMRGAALPALHGDAEVGEEHRAS